MQTRESAQPHRDARDRLAECFRAVRAHSEALAQPLTAEDQTVQSMADCSPTKWHLAHVSWFFETFILVPHLADYEVRHPQFSHLFNSYYEAAGSRHPRFERGLITRPGVVEVAAYRAHVTAGMERLFAAADAETGAETGAQTGAQTWARIAPLVDIGNHHEQQHQELILMDILNLFARNPLKPAYAPYRPSLAREAPALRFLDHPGGIVEIGHAGADFAYDNEGPRHRTLLQPFRLASRPVTNGEWIDFMEDGGYRRADLWLADGWARVKAGEYEAPLYWEHGPGGWDAMTLSGQHPVDRAAPVCHVSYYEADAFARWAGKRLPTEAEWEVVARVHPPEGNFAGSGYLRPVAGPDQEDAPIQLFGDVWEWTQSPYGAYPGYKPAPGALGEYNGKFMASQFVLRGGCCATPDGHVRPTYRNFFYPHQRWAFAGLRLAEDAA